MHSGTIWSCPDIPATVFPCLISTNAESVVESAEDFLVDLSDNLSECIGTIWSCSDLSATVIAGLISANADSADDFTVDLFDNSSECTGTSLVSVLLPDMVLMASDYRISAIGISKRQVNPIRLSQFRTESLRVGSKTHSQFERYVEVML
ncbi:hypothetical protein C1H46_022790 [Malus baccata]|uniref:Uncharacterized protein n=1 Tax=Malus baccata TaxID=106549 RepID=A0A540LYN6_MALBA|nr:hypothetical protein C1H46_022790 [Malus baccata]